MPPRRSARSADRIETPTPSPASSAASPTKASTKAAAPAKAAAATDNRSLVELVEAAVTALAERSGSAPVRIARYLQANFAARLVALGVVGANVDLDDYDDEVTRKIDRQIALAIKRGVTAGTLTQQGGAAGNVRLATAGASPTKAGASSASGKSAVAEDKDEKQDEDAEDAEDDDDDDVPPPSRRRRSSQRVRAQPAKPSKAAAAAMDEDNDDEADDPKDKDADAGDDDDEEEEEEEEEDFAFTASKGKRTRAVAAKPAAAKRTKAEPASRVARVRSAPAALREADDDDNNDADMVPTAASKAPAKRRAAAAKVPDADDDTTLFGALLDESIKVETIVEGWAERYAQSKDNAAAELIALALQTAGYETTFTAAQMRRGEPERVINTLQESPPDSTDYAVVSKDKKFKQFRKRFAAIWQALTRRSVAAPNDRLLATLSEWLVPMTTATVRALRHTATVAILNIQTGYAVACADLQRELVAATQRASKGRDAGTADREATLARLEESWADLMKAVFVHRAIDSAAPVRHDCIIALGVWLDTHDKWIQDDKTCYLGWSLSDRDPLTRLEVLKSLERLFATPDRLARMHEFVLRFRARVVDMIQDIDGDVRAAALTLVQVMAKNSLLETSQVGDVKDDLLTMDAAQRRNAGRLVAEHVLNDLIKTAVNEHIRQHGADGGDEPIAVALRTVAAYLAEQGWLDYFNVANFVDAMWDALTVQVTRGKQTEAVRVVQAWTVMADLLLENRSAASRGRGGSQASKASAKETNLEATIAKLLVASVRKSVGRLVLPKDSKGGMERVSMLTPGVARKPKELQEIEKEQAAASKAVADHFVDALPRLLEKYLSEPAVQQPLTSLLSFIDVAAFVERAGALATVTAALREQVLRQTSKVGLQITVEGLAALSAKPELELTVGAEVTKIVAEVVKQLNRRLSELEVATKDDSEADDTEVANTVQAMALALMRADALTRRFDTAEGLSDRALHLTEIAMQAVPLLQKHIEIEHAESGITAAFVFGQTTALRTFRGLLHSTDKATPVAVEHELALVRRLVDTCLLVLGDTEHAIPGGTALAVMADLARTFSAKAGKRTLSLLATREDGAPAKKAKKGMRTLTPEEVIDQLAMEITTDEFAPALAFVAEIMQQDLPEGFKADASSYMANLISHGGVVDVRHFTDLSVLSCFQVPEVEKSMAYAMSEFADILAADAPVTVMLPAMENSMANYIQGEVDDLNHVKALTNLVRTLLKLPQFADHFDFHESAANFVVREWKESTNKARRDRLVAVYKVFGSLVARPDIDRVHAILLDLHAPRELVDALGKSGGSGKAAARSKDGASTKGTRTPKKEEPILPVFRGSPIK